MVADLDLLAFIRRNIPSVWALDVLVLVRRAPRRSWSASELVQELRASDAVIIGVLESFEREGLLTKGEDDRFSFAPVAQWVDDLTVALEQAYAERPVAVINAIASTDAKLQVLADAFRLKPPKP